MINEQENKTSLNKMSDLEYTKNDTEMMRYRVNGLSYKLGLCGMGASIVAAFVCLNTFNPKNFQVLIIILINIVILLGGFLAAEKVKSYSKNGAIAQLVFGAVCIARIFYIPLIIILKYADYSKALNLVRPEDMSETDFAALKAATMGDAQHYLGATITSKQAASLANAYLPASGYFRGGMAIVFLVIAAACFIAAGITGYKRAAKLAKYLDSIKESK